MDTATFERFRQVVYDHSGIALRDGKEVLVASRVGKRVRALGLPDERAYLEHVSRDATGTEIVHLLDAISTNVTSFFREPDHFDQLRGLVDQWLAEGQRRFRIWSAACSTGEEPYTLAMALLEALDGRTADVRILATDISTQVLERAARGWYTADRLAPVSADLRQRYFEPVTTTGGTVYAARPALRDMVVFRRLNLADVPFPLKGPLDAVFCRNVMIYFDNTVRQRLLTEILRLLKPGGVLMVGHAESLTGSNVGFRAAKPSVYFKPS